MNEQAPDWIPALAVLAAGLVLGAGLLLRAARRGPRLHASPPLPVRDLAGKRDSLLRQIQELEDTASKRTPEQLARERYALELEAARVLLALDDSAAPAQAKRAPKRGRVRPAPAARTGWRALLWSTGFAAALLLLGLFVYRSAKPREPGGSVTGDVAGRQSAGETPSEDAPNTLEAHLARARLFVADQDWREVWMEASAALALQPGNAAALAYEGIVRIAQGRSDLAMGLLERALSADPQLIDAYVYLALAQSRMGRSAEAEATIAQASQRFPARAAELRQFLASVLKEPAVAEAARFTGSSPSR